MPGLFTAAFLSFVIPSLPCGVAPQCLRCPPRRTEHQEDLCLPCRFCLPVPISTPHAHTHSTRPTRTDAHGAAAFSRRGGKQGRHTKATTHEDQCCCYYHQQQSHQHQQCAPAPPVLLHPVHQPGSRTLRPLCIPRGLASLALRNQPPAWGHRPSLPSSSYPSSPRSSSPVLLSTRRFLWDCHPQHRRHEWEQHEGRECG